MGDLNKNKIDNIVLSFIYILVGLSKLVPSLGVIPVLSVIVGIVYCAYRGVLYKLAPIFIFFDNIILYFAGVAVEDIFCAVYIAIFLLRSSKLKTNASTALLVYFICYSLFVVLQHNMMLSIRIILSLVYLIVLIMDLSKRETCTKFCKWYTVAFLAATIYGIGNYLEGSQNELYSVYRYTITFTDPNYAGMFASAALYIAVFLKNEFRPFGRYFIIAVSAISILMTVSSSALMVNALILLIIAAFTISHQRKPNLKGIVRFLLFVLVAFAVLSYAVKIFPGIAETFDRFVGKIDLAQTGNIGKATTARSDIWARHLDYFWNQDSVMKSLFGGNYLTDRGFDKTIFSTVSHNVYVDSLICFGLIGTLFYVIFILYRLIKKIRKFSSSPYNKLSFVLMLLWFFYSFILSMFPFWGFLLFLLNDFGNEEGGTGEVILYRN